MVRLVCERSAFLEALESRVLLSSGPVTIGDANSAAARSLVYSDPDGTIVTVGLKYGQATIDLGDDWTWEVTNGVARGAVRSTIHSVTLADTGVRSRLTFRTAKPRGAAGAEADTRATVAGITGTGLGQLVAGAIDLLGAGIDVAGIKSCRVGRVLDGASLAFGGAATDSMTFSALDVHGSQLTFAGSVRRLTVEEWLDGGGVAASRVGKVQATSGGFTADVVAPEGIGPVAVTGGDLEGSLTAEQGPIGNITVKGTAVFTMDGEQGQGEVRGGRILSAEIRAGGAVKGRSIGAISAIGIGSQDAAVAIFGAGDVGKITTRGRRYKASREVVAGRAETSFDYRAADVFASVTASGRLGAISVAGGDLVGQFDAASVGNVTVVVATPRGVPGRFGGGLSGQIISDTTIGAVLAVGGDMELSLSAGTRLSAVRLKCVTVPAGLERGPGGNWVASSGSALGTLMDLTINLGVADPSAIGAITALGADIALHGSVPFEPPPADVLAESRVITYVSDYDPDPETGRPVAVYSTVGGHVTGELTHAT